MSVYVDRLFPTIPTRRWPYKKACHLFADSREELMAFAEKMKLAPWWIQERTLLHFDLTESRRKEAVHLGAIEVDAKAVVEHIRRNRNAS